MANYYRWIFIYAEDFISSFLLRLTVSVLAPSPHNLQTIFSTSIYSIMRCLHGRRFCKEMKTLSCTIMEI